jgi:carboxypeptidase family protein
MMMPGASTVTNVEGYAPTYYPGTPNAGEAQRVSVKVGVETPNVSFSLAATRLVRISGRVVSASGEPAVRVFLMANMVDRSTVMGMTGFSNATTRADGTFQLNGLAPGTYNVVARPQGMPAAESEFGQARVTVGSEDVDNILIVTGRGAIARGIVTTDDNTAPPFRPQLVSLFARPFEPDVMAVGGGEGRVTDDWTFEMTGLSDRRVLMVNVAESPDWMLKSITLNGVDVTDSPLEFVPGQLVEGLQITLTRKRTELSGNIIDASSRPETDATVIAFAQDAKRWTPGSRFIRTARTNQDGRYNLRGLPPEDYFVVAVRDIEPGEWQDPEVLESLRDVAMQVSFNEGETKVQDLKTARRPGS